MIVSNRLPVGCEMRSSAASRHQLEARKRLRRTSQLDASFNDKVQFHVSASRIVLPSRTFVTAYPYNAVCSVLATKIGGHLPRHVGTPDLLVRRVSQGLEALGTVDLEIGAAGLWTMLVIGASGQRGWGSRCLQLRWGRRWRGRARRCRHRLRCRSWNRHWGR